MEEIKRFVNEYEYTQEAAKEVVGSWWDWKFKKKNIGSIIFVIITILFFLYTGKIRWLVFGLIMLLTLVMFVIKKNKAIKLELERMEVIYKVKSFAVKYVLDDKIKLSTSERESEFEFDIIEGYRETNNFVVLMVKGSMVVAFHKNGFTEGTYEEFVLRVKEITN